MSELPSYLRARKLQRPLHDEPKVDRQRTGFSLVQGRLLLPYYMSLMRVWRVG
jgi:hypothetical protein